MKEDYLTERETRTVMRDTASSCRNITRGEVLQIYVKDMQCGGLTSYMIRI